ncbi:hypothetical protein [Anabaena azotica]|nr:hypothetical protein [Anabaena azotica]
MSKKSSNQSADQVDAVVLSFERKSASNLCKTSKAVSDKTPDI